VSIFGQRHKSSRERGELLLGSPENSGQPA
jgi:hypothetical protein